MSFAFENKTVTSIIKQYPTGHSPYLVLTNDFERYILKTIKNKFDKSSIVKEFLCNSLLKVWKLKVPLAVSFYMGIHRISQWNISFKSYIIFRFL